MTTIDRLRITPSTSAITATDNKPRDRASSTTAEKAHSAAEADSVSTSPVTRSNEQVTRDADAPTLPSSGSATLDGDTAAALSDFMARTHEGTGALMWDALVTMANDSMREMKTANELKIAMIKGKSDAKKNEIKSTEDQISAERGVAANDLGYSIASMAATYFVTRSTDGSESSNQTSASMAQALSQLITQVGKTQSKVAGPQREADEKKLEGMRHQMMQGVFDANIDSAKGNYDSAREQMKLAVKILTEHSERQTQISGTITRI